MEISPKQQNKYSIGKFLKRKKGLRKVDPTASIKEPSESFQKYMNHMFEHGASVNKVAVADFKLKNGLSYSGLIATEKIITDEIIIRVPQPLLLNTKHAYFSDIRYIFCENPKYFSPSYTSSWEDHMLLVYLVRESGRGEQSEWYHLISNLPREIDYLIFWTQEELDSLEDVSAVRLAKQYRDEYDKDEAFVLELSQRYPDALKPEVFTKENIRWIYTHLVTRCFGKYLEYITMIPIAEMFNHDCTDVYYDLEYYANNPNIPKDYSMEEPKEVPEEEFDDNKTSEGSNNSEDEEFDSDYEYNKDGITLEVEEKGLTERLQGLSILDEIRMRSDDVENLLINDLDWGDGFSIFFVNEAHKTAASILERYRTREIDIAAARNLFSSLEIAAIIFKNEARKFYKRIYKVSEDAVTPKQRQKFIDEIEEKDRKEKELGLEGKSVDELFGLDPEWKDDTFDNFVMKASWKDQFEKGSQVFFCYGRLSNRCTLLRYGISLEYNKYEHVHLKVPYLKYLKDTEWLVHKIKYFKMSRYMRFKLKRTKVNVSFLNYCKAIYFRLDCLNQESLIKPLDIDLEIKAVKKACKILQRFLNRFEKSPEENKKLLEDPNVDYHGYFSAVYRLERQRLVIFHQRALQVVETILNRIKHGFNLESALLRVQELESEDECKRNRIFLADYIAMLKDYREDNVTKIS